MAANVTLVEINIYEAMTPLVSGYLQAYACQHNELRQAYRFEKLSFSRATPLDEIQAALLSSDSVLYAFSCYVWNMGHVKTLLAKLREHRPDALVLLGGPQVMQHAERYLRPGDERMLVCNGEGEQTFAGILRQLLQTQPDFAAVKGLSFYHSGELITTPGEERIRDLDDIPSPFLTGVFDGQDYQTSVIETNRGCPFRCGFCYWGAANNDRVFKFSENRIRDEITWLAERGVPVLYIADANWGMLKRDLDLSRHIVRCKEQYYYPLAVIFSAAKNSPQRVTETTRIFTEAGLVNTQPISMQSLDPTTLEYADRKNIKLSAYEKLQNDLNGRNIGSFIELIWPLPGETLSSFKRGVEHLCERGAATLIVYAHLLLHNTPIYKNRDAYRLATRRAADDAGEVEIITETADVSHQQFREGVWFIYAVKALYNTHCLVTLSAYLHHQRLMSYADLFTAFAEFCQTRPEHPFTRFCQKSVDEIRYYELTNYPTIYHMVLHGERRAFERLLRDFAAAQPWWQDDRARALFEVDLLGKPYLYRNTPVHRPEHDFEHIQVVDVLDRGYLVEVSGGLPSLLRRYAAGLMSDPAIDKSSVVHIDHEKAHQPYRPRGNEGINIDYCNRMITRIGNILPSWSSQSA